MVWVGGGEGDEVEEAAAAGRLGAEKPRSRSKSKWGEDACVCFANCASSCTELIPTSVT